ncbi:MAG: metallopeptidase family protein [Armatimonadetes bacterium]|nr:metallopeptidase family protein [Armatimonadota bacterium]
MSPKRFDRLVRQALSTLPEEFREYLHNVLITVEPEPRPEHLEEMQDDTLLGLYIGTPLTEQGLDELYHLPDRILLFQGPLEAMCRTDQELAEQVRITVVHEIGHHFGLSEEEIVAVLGP